MPEIPDFAFTRNVPLEGSLPTQNVSVSPEAFGGGLADGAKALGQGIYQRAMLQAEFNNKAAVDQGISDSMKKFNDILSNPETGYLTKLGKNATDGYGDAIQAMSEAQNDIANTMPSPNARAAFLETSNWALRQSERTAAMHASQQQNLYWRQAAKASQESTIDYMSLNYNNDKIWDEGIGKLKENQAHIDALDGVDPATHKQNADAIVSAAATNRVSRWADQDPEKAQAWYNDHQDLFTSKDSLHLDNMFRTTMGAITADKAADHFLSGGGGATLDSFLAATEKAESGGSQAAFNPNTGGKGGPSVGAMQLQEATARQVSHDLGISYDPALLKADTPEGKAYNEQLGKAYATQVFNRYSGNPVLGGMAYVAGPGQVDTWISKFGDPRTGAISNEDFIAKVKAAGNPQTAARGELMLKNVSIVQGTLPTSADPRDHEADTVARIEEIYGDSPEGKKVVTAYRSKVALIGQQIDAQRRDSYNTLLDQISQNNVLSENDVMKDPSLKVDWMQLTAKQRNELSTQMYKQASGDHDVTPDGLRNYYTLKGMAKTDPGVFAAQDISKYPGMNLKQQQELMLEQTEISKKPADNAFVSKAISISKQVSPIISQLEQRGNKDEFNQYVGRLNQEINTFQQVHGRLPNDSDIRKMVPDMLELTGTYGYGFQQPYNSFITGVDDKSAEDISKWYRLKFGKEPSNAQIAWWYGQLQGAKK